MPRSYKYSAQPYREAGSGFVASTHDVEDAILKANKNKNTEKFTQEMFAAYYAFAGIGDRSTALKLFKNNVSFDDVNDYCATGLFPIEDYQTMIKCKTNGVNPDDIAAIKNHAENKKCVIPSSFITLLSVKDFTEIVGFKEKVIKNIDILISEFSRRNMDMANLVNIATLCVYYAIPVLEYFKAYLIFPNLTVIHFSKMYSFGLDSDVLFYHKQNNSKARESKFYETVLRISGATKNRDLLKAMFIINETRKDVIQKLELSGVEPQKIVLLLKAGYDADSILSNPHYADFDDETLQALIELRK